jgi:hypothetical protein
MFCNGAGNANHAASEFIRAHAFNLNAACPRSFVFCILPPIVIQAAAHVPANSLEKFLPRRILRPRAEDLRLSFSRCPSFTTSKI